MLRKIALSLSLIVSFVLIAQSVIVCAQFGGQAGIGGNAGVGGGASSGSCTAPTMTYDWTPVANAASTGNPGMNDSISSNTASQATGGNAPAYNATGGPGSKPELTFNGSSSSLNLASMVPTSWTTVSGYLIFEPATLTGQEAIMSNGTSFGWFWDINHVGPMDVTVDASTYISNTGSLTAASWRTEAFQYDPSSGVWTFHDVASGTASADGSGTTTATPSSLGWNVIGSFAGVTYFFNGSLAEIALYNGSLNLTTLATYSQCQYGI